ncbi:MAG: glycine cleavage system aminomethyltransferase GcvT [Deltaproteobacteria bacterium]|nr:MAG: glycine cleavage system aminomethyltransferase GcvT [Deltaproteobacteria bacterium]
MSLRRTVFFEDHVDAGGRMVPFAGFELAVQYEGLRQEHECVRQRVGLFDVSHMGEVFVRGPKALQAVQHAITNDASRLDDGQAIYTCMCTSQGGVVDDLVVYRLDEEEFLICVNAANRDKDFAFLQANNPHGADLVDEGDRWAQLALQGPLAQRVLQRVTQEHLDDLPRYTMFFDRSTVAGVEGCLIARTGYTGEDGFEIFAPARSARPLWTALLEAGAPEGIKPCGLGARDTLRLEAGMHLYGHELTEDTTPWQAGLGGVVALEKGSDFVGRSALIERKGTASERLCALVMRDKRIPRQGMPLVSEGEYAGRITSGTRSPTLGYGIALGYVRSDLARVGRELQVDVRGSLSPAEVVRRPFYKRTT